MTTLIQRLAAFTSACPPSVRGFLDPALPKLAADFDLDAADPANVHRLPFWLAIPALAHKEWSRARQSSKNDAVVQDALWGQFCLFLVFRMQDDVFDGQTDATGLVYVSNLLLVEAQRTFLSRFSAVSPFWGEYYQGIRRTSAALLRTRAVQSADTFRKRTLLDCYRETDRVLLVGLRAVCDAHGHAEAFPALRRFSGHLSIAAHIEDDLLDIEEDAAQGCWNFAARVTMERMGMTSGGVEARLAAIGRALLGTDAHKRIIDTVSRQLAAAAGLSRSIGMAGLGDLVAARIAALDEQRRMFHRARVEFIFTAGVPG